MRIAKMFGVILGVLLLALIVPVLIGMIGRSPIAIFALLALAIVAMILTWGRRMDGAASKPWFLRRRNLGAPKTHDRLVQDDDAVRQRTDAQHQQRRSDAD